MTVQVLAPRDVSTTLNYHSALNDETPYNYVNEPPPGVPKTNVGQDTHPVIIHDARGKEVELGLDKSGFQFINYPSVEKDFLDEEKIKLVYYAEVEEILKKYAAAKKVLIFDHTIRRNYDDGALQQTPSLKAKVIPEQQRVHVDQTFEAAAQRVKLHLGDDAERLLKGRYRIINVWRPIGHPVAHSPLAVADYRSLDPKADLVFTRHIYPDQTPDEVILIKCFDSDVDRARLTPHSAFMDDTSPKEAPLRQSIEVRALVFDTE